MLTDLNTRIAASPERTRIPERLETRFAATLAAGDGGIALFIALVLFGGQSNTPIAALVAAALICCAFWACGLYKRSYAVYPRDEVYYACTAVLAAALPVLLVVGGVGQISTGAICVMLIFTAIATSAWHAGLHLQRRTEPALPAARSSITPAAWHAREAPAYLLTKRVFDVTVALLALAATLPIMVAAAVAIVLESGRPVLFRQERVGRDGARFDVLKFRTMRRDAGSDWARPGDARITRTGGFLRRTSIDELPQLFNVLRGEMSIVGPRPEMAEFAERFARELPSYVQRHIVTPGITGWAQLYFKRNFRPEDVREVLPYDLFYVERASVVIDAALLLKTLVEVIFHRAV